MTDYVLQAGDWITEPGSYTAFAMAVIAVLAFYTGRVVSKGHVDVLRAEFDARFALLLNDRDYHRSIAEKLILTNAKAIEVIKLATLRDPPNAVS